ncbi:hypothetical protein MG293_006855 [Ovis ammon polii]|uniref:Uncharacterized protein n=1 Tax=Ovis ammon polii TaxID=230172 RepID=A0AAD4UDJ2_OVIAM|nr:hypothetical protein MG293_006855 [Ovis ammon polii]
MNSEGDISQCLKRHLRTRNRWKFGGWIPSLELKPDAMLNKTAWSTAMSPERMELLSVGSSPLEHHAVALITLLNGVLHAQGQDNSGLTVGNGSITIVITWTMTVEDFRHKFLLSQVNILYNGQSGVVDKLDVGNMPQILIANGPNLSSHKSNSCPVKGIPGGALLVSLASIRELSSEPQGSTEDLEKRGNSDPLVQGCEGLTRKGRENCTFRNQFLKDCQSLDEYEGLPVSGKSELSSD